MMSHLLMLARAKTKSSSEADRSVTTPRVEVSINKLVHEPLTAFVLPREQADEKSLVD
jgi:hypothetical protein